MKKIKSLWDYYSENISNKNNLTEEQQFMKNIKYFKYANEYIHLLNNFYDNYKDIINEYILNKEYDLMIDILDSLTYDNYNAWNVKIGENKHRNNIIYMIDKHL